MKRNNPHQIGPGSAALVNALSVSEAKLIVKNELAKFSTEINGCTVSTRVLKKGAYPRKGIKKWLPKQFQTLPKSQCKVEVTHLVWRANGKQVPNYHDNMDVIHTCHNGKAKYDGDQVCITYSHLGISSHHNNMKAQHCQTITECPFCKLKSTTCNHQPICRGTPEEQEFLHTQKKPRRITVEFTDGSIDVLEFK